MKWKLVQRKVSELIPYDKNPRTITEQGLKDLKKSLDKFGLAEPIVINTDNVICGGHGRWLTLQAQGIDKCDCYIPERTLTPKEFQELNIRLNKNTAGFWDFDMLANNFEVEDLLEWGWEKYEFNMFDELDESMFQLNPPESHREPKEKDELHKCPACGFEF